MNLRTPLFSVLVALLVSYNAFAGISIFRGDTIPGGVDSGFVKPERVKEEVSFPGWENAWLQNVRKNIDTTIPTKNKALAGTYTVIVQFVFDREGNISDVRPLTNHGFGMEEIVMRPLKKSTRWEPARQNGRVVKAYGKVLVTFLVEGKRKKKKTKIISIFKQQ